MCRTKKWADGRSLFRMCRAASRVGCSCRAEIFGVRVDDVGLAGGVRGGKRVKIWE